MFWNNATVFLAFKKTKPTKGSLFRRKLQKSENGVCSGTDEALLHFLAVNDFNSRKGCA